jgi:hypothetical protein
VEEQIPPTDADESMPGSENHRDHVEHRGDHLVIQMLQIILDETELASPAVV